MNSLIKPFKNLVNACVFIVLAVLVFMGASSITVGSKYIWTWVGTLNENPMYAVPKDTLDVASFGSSTGMTSFSPSELWKEYGISAYNYSSEQQSPIISYYYLKEVLKQQDVKVVLLNTHMMFGGWDTGIQRKAFDRIKWSEDKWEGVNSFVEMKEYDSFFSYVFPVYKFHTRWKGLSNYDLSYDIENKNNFPYAIHNGYLMGHGNQAASDGWTGLTDTGKDAAAMKPDATEYYSKFIQLCQQNDVAVVLYSQIYDGNPDLHNAVQAFADSFGVPFVDFHMAETIAAAGIDLTTDIGGHQSTAGAVKDSIYLGKYLKENYDLPDHRGDAKYAWQDKELVAYEKDLFPVMLRNTKSFYDYLDKIENADVDYTVFFTVADEASGALTDELKQKLAEFGFQTDFTGKWRNAFIGVWQNGEIVYEHISETTNNPETDILEYKNTLPNGSEYYLKSAGYDVGSASSIKIADKEYSKNSRGFNIVVYDNEMNRVIDSVNWDTCGEPGLAAKR